MKMQERTMTDKNAGHDMMTLQDMTLADESAGGDNAGHNNVGENRLCTFCQVVG